MKLAVIPARGGSKRIPQKNIKDFCGKPIIAYSIETAINSKLFDRVIVSTDDKEITEIARQYGAETPFTRPDQLADDFTGTNAIVKHALQFFNDEGTSFTHACCIYATAPLLQTRYLTQGLNDLLDSNADFAFSVTRFDFPVQRALRITPNNRVDALFPEYSDSRSQDLEQAYHDAGQFYWGTADAFLDDKTLMSPGSIPVVLPGKYVQDIDSPDDWEQAELLYKILQQ